MEQALDEAFEDGSRHKGSYDDQRQMVIHDVNLDIESLKVPLNPIGPCPCPDNPWTPAIKGAFIRRSEEEGRAVPAPAPAPQEGGAVAPGGGEAGDQDQDQEEEEVGEAGEEEEGEEPVTLASFRSLLDMLAEQQRRWEWSWMDGRDLLP